MAQALVTGGAGFIGSHLARSLINRRHRVWILDDLSGGFKDNLPPSAHFTKGSILNQRLIRDLFQKHRFDYVFHLASYAAEGLSHFIKRFNYRTNLIGSVNLINQAILAKVKCFVFTSSIAVYGRNKLPMTENLTPRPEDSYGIAKLAVERELAITAKLFGLPYIIFRPHNVYGEHQNIGDRYRNVIGIFMNQLMHHQPLTIFGSGRQKRAFSYISDVAPIIAGSVANPKAYNQVFNLGSDIPCTVNHLAKIVARAFRVKPKINYLAPRYEVQAAYADHSKARRILKATAKVSLTQGISRMAAWAKSHGARRSRPYKNIEVPINLPPIWKK